MLDDSLRPTPDAEVILVKAGWSPGRRVDISKWVELLQADGYELFPVAEAIMRSYGGLDLEHPGYGGISKHDFEIDPTYWVGEQDRLNYVRRITGARLCPLGQTSGAAMLGVLDDGRVVGELEGDLLVLGRNWREALDNLLLGRGEDLKLTEGYEPLDPRQA